MQAFFKGLLGFKKSLLFREIFFKIDPKRKDLKMISFFNKLGESWIAKGIFFLLGLSMMIFWGLGGISNTSSSDSTAFQVGDRQVSLLEVSHTFDQERDKMAKISGGYMTPKRALQAGLLNQVVQQLVARELNAQIQEEIGLTASDDAVRRYIENNPVFADNLGKFDAQLFYAYLSQLNLTQAELAHQMRAELAHQHLTRTLAHATPRDPLLMKQVAQVKKEKREVVGAFLSLEKQAVGTPDAEELKDYYEAYREEFVIPEVRSLRVVTLKSVDFKNDYALLSAAVRQLEDALGAGQTLQEACQLLKVNAGQIVTVTADGLDKQGKTQANLKPLLQEAFSLLEGEATSFVDTEGGFMVAGVEKITPRSYKEFSSVKAEVTALWQKEQQKGRLTKETQELLAALKAGKGWQQYVPKTTVLSQSEFGQYPKDVADVLLQQPIGMEYVTSFPTEKGTWVAYAKRAIPSKEEPTTEEQTVAVQDWTQDLISAVQQAYAEKYPIDINVDVIQKAFSVYENQEE